MSQIIQSIRMRRCFADIMHQKMAINKDIWVITADLGYKMWDDIAKDYPDRFLNVGASEQAMMGLAVGLAVTKAASGGFNRCGLFERSCFENFTHHRLSSSHLWGL